MMLRSRARARCPHRRREAVPRSRGSRPSRRSRRCRRPDPRDHRRHWPDPMAVHEALRLRAGRHHGPAARRGRAGHGRRRRGLLDPPDRLMVDQTRPRCWSTAVARLPRSRRASRSGADPDVHDAGWHGDRTTRCARSCRRRTAGRSGQLASLFLTTSGAALGSPLGPNAHHRRDIDQLAARAVGSCLPRCCSGARPSAAGWRWSS
ncbi:hypothetical protein HBB16_05765 [Pseudonocardia sp. MCCB 268]|nr:hypothetical protein [Pseudonocardia cytotoxica]